VAPWCRPARMITSTGAAVLCSVNMHIYFEDVRTFYL
jgi:hypothetical protein